MSHVAAVPITARLRLDLQRAWAVLPRRQRRLWLIASLWTAIHLVGLGVAILFATEFNPDELRGWSDVVAYRDAGEAFRQRAALYELTAWEDPMTYYYHPAFALAASWVSRVPFRLTAFIWFLLQTAAYLAALAVWIRVLRIWGLENLADGAARWLPLALVFTEWIVNLVYGNLTSTLLLLSGLLTLLILRARPGWAALAALPILITKPQWLFPLVLPVILRRWRLLMVLLVVLAAAYLALNGAYVLAAGPDYGRETLHDYGRFLTTLESNYTWGGHTHAFENFNHSWRQILISYWGDQSWVPATSTLLKLALIAPVLALIVAAWRLPGGPEQHPALALWIVGLSYLAAMAMLAQLWEILGSIVFFLAIQGTSSIWLRRLSWLYLVYALYEIPALFGFITGWSWLILPQSVPLTMLALLLLYAVLSTLAIRETAQANRSIDAYSHLR